MLKHLQSSTIAEVIRLAEAAKGSRRSISDFEYKQLPTEERLQRLALTDEERELHEYLERLKDDQMTELMALMWLGRGAPGERNYPELVNYASTMLDNAASYVRKPKLADYLRRGLAKLGA